MLVHLTRLFSCFAFVVVAAGALTPLTAIAAPEIVLVEETWQLQVATTDSNSAAPQVATAFSPTGGVDGVHAIFELNHQSVPDFSPGGLHLQLWDGEDSLDTHSFPSDEVMSGGEEVVTWKQTMRLDGDTLTFSIDGGASNTWGSFGGQGHLTDSVNTSLHNLNGYSAAVSAQNSGVTYAGNRVTKLVLTKVRVVNATGQEYVDETDRVVHEN